MEKPQLRLAIEAEPLFTDSKKLINIVKEIPFSLSYRRHLVELDGKELFNPIKFIDTINQNCIDYTLGDDVHNDLDINDLVRGKVEEMKLQAEAECYNIGVSIPVVRRHKEMITCQGRLVSRKSAGLGINASEIRELDYKVPYYTFQGSLDLYFIEGFSSQFPHL